MFWCPCRYTGNVSASEHVNRVGGLVGTLNKGFLSGCYATGPSAVLCARVRRGVP